MKYKIIAEEYLEDFSEVVTKFLTKGWLLYGNPYYNGKYHCQAIVFDENITVLHATTQPEADLFH